MQGAFWMYHNDGIIFNHEKLPSLYKLINKIYNLNVNRIYIRKLSNE